MKLDFANAYFLALLALLVPLGWIYFRWLRKKTRAVRFSDLRTIVQVNSRWARFNAHVPFALRLMALTLLVVALARPRSGSSWEDITSEGIDIVLTVDLSTSMLAEDLARGTNRLDAAKEVVTDFISRRRNDRIGLVAFAAKAVTQCPPTLDYSVLASQVKSLKIGSIEDGTAIGVALASSVNRLRNSRAKSRVIILLTDGMNNRGEVDPHTAARIAQAKGIRVYTIGAGTRGMAPVPVRDRFGQVELRQMKVEIDEELLKEIAANTGGQYYRATDKKELDQIYRNIDELEKTKVEVREYTRYQELFAWFLIPGVILFFLEFLMAGTRFRTIP